MTKKIAIIISLIMLLAVGLGTYLSLTRKSLVSPQAPVKKLIEIKVASWKTYQNKDFSFQYPADWQIATQESKISSGRLQTETISNIAPPTITPIGTGAAVKIQPPEGGSITVQTTKTASQSAQQFPSPQFAPATKLKLGKTEIQTYIAKQQGVLISYLIIPYQVGATSYTLLFDYYNYQHPDWDYPTLFNQVISSFKFKSEK